MKEGKSVFKRFSLSLPRKLSKKGAPEGRGRTVKGPPGGLPDRLSESWDAYAPSPNASTFASSQTPASQMVLDISRSSPILNLDAITPGSSGDGESFERHLTNVSSRNVIPGPTQTDNSTKTPAVNDAPLTFPRFDNSPIEEPVSPVSNTFQRPTVRSKSLVERTRPQTFGVHFERSKPPVRSEYTSTLFSSDYMKPASIGRNESHKRGRRITLGTPTAPRSMPPLLPIRDPSVQSHIHTHTHCCNETRPVQQAPVTTEEAYNNLFASAAVSLFLLIILAAGKDVLYLLALLPVLSALVKHVDFRDFQDAFPITKQKLQTLITI